MDLPRVTEILRCYTAYERVPHEILERAAARGSTVHAICAGIAKGAWVPEGMIAAEFLGYVKSFRQWVEAQVRSFEIVETRYTDTTLGFTGQLDFVVIGKDGHQYLVDIKTSYRPQKTYPIQMAAYDYLLRQTGTHVYGAMVVQLDKEGGFPDIDFIEDLKPYWRVFESALLCWNYFFKKKVKSAKARPKEDEVEQL